MSDPALAPEVIQALSTERAAFLNEVVAAASEFVQAKAEEERINAKPDKSVNVLKTKFLSRWPLKFRSMKDPANVSKVNRELDAFNETVGIQKTLLSHPEKQMAVENILFTLGPVDPAEVQETVLQLWELDLMAASVARATIDEDLKELIVVPPGFADNLKTAIAHSDLRIKFPLVKVVGDVIVKETKTGTELVNQEDMDEYLTGQFAHVSSKLAREMSAML